MEASFAALQRECWLSAVEDGHELVLPAATAYRARYCASGMHQARAADVRMPGEQVLDRHLLQLWPAPLRDDAILRQTSEIAAYWHEVARTSPPPPRTPEERAAEAERQAAEAAAAERLVEVDRWGGNLPRDRL